jgi:hypothetical protein
MKIEHVNRIRVFAEADKNERTYAMTRSAWTRWIASQVVFYDALPDAHLQSYVHQGYSEASVHVLKELFQVDGVASVVIRKHQLTISKGSAWDWSEVQPGILSVLRRGYFADAYEFVTVDDTTVASASKR